MIPANAAASIHQRILNKAAAENRPFNELLQYYAMERFLYRMGTSPHCKQFVLKGALVFIAWQAPLTRPTRDLDFLGFTENSIANLVQIVQQVCAQPVEPDGMVFDPASVAGEIIKEEADYTGIRISFQGLLGNAKTHMRLDVGFADVVTPPPSELEFPTILANMDKPRIRAYPPETVIAEKFQTLVTLGMINSRMKDFFDLWFMAKSMQFNFNLLSEAISNTFTQRKTIIPDESPVAFTAEFADQKQALWASFVKKHQITETPAILSEVTEMLNEFFNPLIFPTPEPPTRWSPASGWEK